jgi:cytoskeletal protein CcmA (bactofilin family)
MNVKIRRHVLKRLKWVIAMLVLVAVPVFGWVSIANAQKFSNTIEEGRTVNSSLYSSGKTIDIKGTINGDVYCAGQNIRIEAVVKGDVICGGQDITIDGVVEGSVRAGGQFVTIKGTVARSVSVASMNFSLDAGAKVGQDLTVVGDNSNIKGMVGRDVTVSGNTLAFNGPVGRNVHATGTNVQLKGSARVAGDFNYTSDREVNKAKDAVVGGDVSQVKANKNVQSSPRFSLGLYLFLLFGLLIIYLVIAYFFPQFLRRTSDKIKVGYLKTFLVGLAASFLLPMLSLGLIISIVGIPLVAFLLLGWLFASTLAFPIAAFFVGRLIFREKRKNPLLIMLVGGAILTTTYFFWVIGPFFIMLSYWLGLGALLLTLRDNARPSDPDMEAPEPIQVEEPVEPVEPKKPRKKKVVAAK